MRAASIAKLAAPGVLAALIAGACANLGDGASSPAQDYLADPAAVRRGKLIFVGTCGAYCHSNQPGNRDAPYLFDCSWKHGGSDREIFHTISTGVPDTRMPAFGGKLPEGDEDIWKLVAYLRSKADCP